MVTSVADKKVTTHLRAYQQEAGTVIRSIREVAPDTFDIPVIDSKDRKVWKRVQVPTGFNGKEG